MYITRKRRNKLSHIKIGNINQAQGKPFTTLFWSKGISHMHRKIQDIKILIEQHKPHIFGLAEANVLTSHNLADIQIPNYNLHLTTSIGNPNISVARVAAYTHKSITVRRRPDLEDNELQLICLEAGLPRMKKSLYIVGYRQWQLSGDRASSSLAAQDERWTRLFDKWEAALEEGKEVVTVMDANLDALTWRNEPRHSTSTTHRSLIDNIHDRILPMGVEMMTPPLPTWARGDHRSCLDHVYTTSPAKLSAVSVIWTGMSDHAANKFHRYTKALQIIETYLKEKNVQKLQTQRV